MEFPNHRLPLLSPSLSNPTNLHCCVAIRYCHLDIMALPPKLYQWLVGVFASLGSLTYGYDLGVIAQVIAAKSFVAKFGDDPAQIGAVVAVFTGGAFFGAMFAAPSGDMLGRKWTILIGAVIFLLGGALQTSAQNIAYMMAGRAIAGLGCV
jgi:MFS family permease